MDMALLAIEELHWWDWDFGYGDRKKGPWWRDGDPGIGVLSFS